MQSARDFAARLTLVLKALSISRARLAADTGIDKSIVGRWCAGTYAPSAHNLERLTQAIALRRPGFTMIDWDLDLPALATRLGVRLEPVPVAAAAGDHWLPVSAAQSAREVIRVGDQYPGLYVQIRRRITGAPALFAGLITIWRDGDTLVFSYSGPFWSFQGRLLILQHQLFAVGEDAMVGEGLAFFVLNSVSGGAALVLDGVMSSVAGDRERVPTACPVVWLRIGDLDDTRAPVDAARLEHLHAAIAAQVEAGAVAVLSGPVIVAQVTAQVGSVRADGGIDAHLRMPASRGFTATARDASADIVAAAARWRAALA